MLADMTSATAPSKLFLRQTWLTIITSATGRQSTSWLKAPSMNEAQHFRSNMNHIFNERCERAHAPELNKHDATPMIHIAKDITAAACIVSVHVLRFDQTETLNTIHRN